MTKRQMEERIAILEEVMEQVRQLLDQALEHVPGEISAPVGQEMDRQEETLLEGR
jgi:hypothetical protein